MPKTGFHMPTELDSEEYIVSYMRYKLGKIKDLSKKVQKYSEHIQQAKDILEKVRFS